LIDTEKIAKLQLQSDCTHFTHFSELSLIQQILPDIVQLQQERIAKNTGSRASRRSFFREKEFLILIFLEDIAGKHWISGQKL